MRAPAVIYVTYVWASIGAVTVTDVTPAESRVRFIAGYYSVIREF